MLQTVEAEVDVNGNVRLLEPIKVSRTTRAILTLLESTGSPIKDQGTATAVLEFLRSNRLPIEAKPSEEEIGAQIEEARSSGEYTK